MVVQDRVWLESKIRSPELIYLPFFNTFYNVKYPGRMSHALAADEFEGQSRQDLKVCFHVCPTVVYGIRPFDTKHVYYDIYIWCRRELNPNISNHCSGRANAISGSISLAILAAREW